MKLFTLNASAALLKSTTISVCLIGLVFFPGNSFGQQAISHIITDYNNYWQSGVGSINTVKPVNSHNLLAFTYNGIQYSTGVNDNILSQNNQSYIASDFWSLPVEGITGTVNSSTKIGLGEMYDGVHNGAPAVSPENDIARYLTDGIKGLNIGTCVANLPVGNLNLLISNINKTSIGDGIPDILVTQVADPSGSYDRYSFKDINGNVIGISRDIIFPTIAPVGNWTADFYDASSNPMRLTAGYINTDRAIRLWAADLSDFGITQENFHLIRRFSIALSGSSDVAFAAYNNRSFNISLVLPVKLVDFSAKLKNETAQLNWQTSSEINSLHFTIEKSTDNINFSAIQQIAAAGNSSVTLNYSATDRQVLASANYYRLKMTDINGRIEYSKIVQINTSANKISMQLFPNPASDQVTISHPATTAGTARIYNNQGALVKQATSSMNSTRSTIQLDGLAKGMYYLSFTTASGQATQPFVIR